MTTPHPRRRWLQFSLRTMFVVVTVLCVWLGVVVKQARDHRLAVKMILESGGTIVYEHQLSYRHMPPSTGASRPMGPRLPPGPEWLRGLVGDEYFFTVTKLILLGPNFTDTSLLAVGKLTDVKSLSFHDAEITDAGLLHLKRLTNLDTLVILNSSVTDDGVKKLQQALSNCNIIH